MVNSDRFPVYPLDIYVATEQGEAEIRAGATTLPAGELELLVMADSRTNIGDMEQRAQHMQSLALRDMIRSLLSKGLLRRATVAEEEGLSLDFSFLQDPAKPVPSAGAQASADR